MKPLIICIVGESGVGKDLVVEYLQNKYNIIKMDNLKDIKLKNTYIIDEGGLIYLQYHFGGDYNIKSIRVRRNLDLRRANGITKDKIRKDKLKFHLNDFDYKINNNGSKEELFKRVDEIYKTLEKTNEK